MDTYGIVTISLQLQWRKGLRLLVESRESIPRSTGIFLEQGGRITCEVTGRRQLRKGLEVPCVYRFEAEDKKLTNKLKKVFGSIEGRFTHSCPYWLDFFVLLHVIVFQYVLIYYLIVRMRKSYSAASAWRHIQLSGLFTYPALSRRHLGQWCPDNRGCTLQYYNTLYIAKKMVGN